MRFVLMMIAALSATAQAADDPAMVAKYRQTMMRGVGAHMGQLGLVTKGKIDRKDDLLVNAEAILHAAERYRDLFPEGSGPEKVKTEALAAVWKDPAGFTKANDTWLAASKGLVEAIKNKKGDEAIANAFGELGKACGGCHDTFKQDD